MEIVYQYTKLRREFGRQLQLCEQGPEMCDSVLANVDEQRKYILRNPIHADTQNTPSMSEHTVNTIRADYASSGANHAEGGWPRDVNVHDPEMTQRYRRKVEKEDQYIACVQSKAPEIEHYVYQNNAVDMYSTYYTELEPLQRYEHASCRTVNVYRDPAAPARSISSLAWQPDGGHRFAAAYNDVTFNRTARGPLASYIWDVENANAPETTVAPPCALLDLQFNPRDSNTLVGGLINGQVAVWDRRAGGAARAVCAPHVAHRDLVRNVIFINAKSGQEFFSGSADGTCRWWDMRKMDEIIEEMILDVVKYSFDVPSMQNAHGVCSLEYEPTIPTRFMVGTENGYVLLANRKGKTALEKIPIKLEAHLGPVWTVERHPGFLKNFLTVGDWTARVWSEDCRDSAVLWTPPHRHRVSVGTWSPSRISLMLLGCGDGSLEVWDLLRSQRAPAATMQLGADPLLRLRMHEAGSLLMCGSRNGNIYMAEMSQSLAESDKNDKALMSQVLERESKRERILEARQREIRLKLRQAEEGGHASPSASATKLDAALGDHDLAEAAAEYMLQVKKEMLSL